MNTTGIGEETPADPADKGEQLEHEIEVIRDNLGNLVGELDHRRHRLFNVGAQLRGHAIPLAIGVVTIAVLIAGGIAVSRARQRPNLRTRVRRLRKAVLGASSSALLRKGTAPAVRKREKEPGATGWRILAAAGTAVASVLARRLAERLMARPESRPGRSESGWPKACPENT